MTMWPGKALATGPEKDVADVVCCCCPSAPGCTAEVGEVGASVIPGTEMKYTEPVGSVPP